MSAAALVAIYGGMLIFDAVVLAGTSYLIGWRDWSAWWMVLAVFMCAGSNPRRIIEAWQDSATASARAQRTTNNKD